MALVNEEIRKEAHNAEMALRQCPIIELMSGILVLANHRWLSDSDLRKILEAHGGYWSGRKGAVHDILEAQVKLYEEIVTKGRQGEDIRYYNSIFARLQDNQRELGLPLNPAQHLDVDKRKIPTPSS